MTNKDNPVGEHGFKYVSVVELIAVEITRNAFFDLIGNPHPKNPAQRRAVRKAKDILSALIRSVVVPRM